MWAQINSAGAVAASSGVTTSQSQGTGILDLTFAQDVSKCAVTTGINGAIANWDVRTAISGSKVTVTTFLNNGTLPYANLPVSVAVFC